MPTSLPAFANRALPLAAAILAGCAMAPAPGPVLLSAFVVLGEDGAAVARAIVAGAACPTIVLDGRTLPMALRAAPATPAQRRTASDPTDSKPSAFPVATCEAAIPPATASAVLLGRALPLPRARAERIVVLGDTGCRLKKFGANFQDCNDPQAYPFARVAAAAAAFGPDLVVHVGDYHYRENPCPAERPGCAGSSWGYGWDAWRDDFFDPAASLLRAAPWVMARGNHESCSRAGQGWWRFLDPRPLQAGRDCDHERDDAVGNYSDPYAVPIGAGAQLLVFDSASTKAKGFAPGSAALLRYAGDYRKLEALARRAPYNLAVGHHPLLGLSAEAEGKERQVVLFGGDAGLQQAFGGVDPLLLPAAVQALLSGHAHLWQQVSFASDHPSQFISGFAGSARDDALPPVTLPPAVAPAPGALVDSLSIWGTGFGFMSMERSGADSWDVKVWDQDGKLRNRCQLRGRKSSCLRAQVE